MGRYATQTADKVNRLLLYAPPWIREAHRPAAKLRLGLIKHGRWSKARKRIAKRRAGRKEKGLMPAAWFEAWSRPHLPPTPVGPSRTPPVVRTPNGTVQDTREYWMAGKPLWEPSEVKAAHLNCGGEWDALVTGAQAVFRQLNMHPINALSNRAEHSPTFPMRRIVSQLFREVELFLDESHSANKSLKPKSGAVAFRA